jgi:hypothetical protein
MKISVGSCFKKVAELNQAFIARKLFPGEGLLGGPVKFVCLYKQHKNK